MSHITECNGKWEIGSSRGRGVCLCASGVDIRPYFQSYCNTTIYLSFVWCRVLFLSSFTVVVDLSKSTTCLHSYISIYSKICIMFPLTLCTIHEYKAGNGVSEFTHSNCITLSYYSSPKHNESAS